MPRGRAKNSNAIAESRSCTACGGPVAPGGRRNPLGVYYCSQNVCQNAKQRAYYAAIRANNGRPWAPEYCSKCGKALKPRRLRVGETQMGRWCSAGACQRHRMATLRSGTAPKPVMPESLVKELKEHQAEVLFYSRALKFERVTCPTCGVTDAVQGYPHPNEYAEKCTGTGDEWVSKVSVGRVWPDRWYDPSDTIAPHD